MDRQIDQQIYSEQMITQMKEAGERYGDIMERPHPVSLKYRPMPQMDRAAQFSPFAALTGYHTDIREAEQQFAENEADGLSRERWQEDERFYDE